MSTAVNEVNGQRERTGKLEPVIGSERTTPMPSFAPTTWTVVVDSDETYLRKDVGTRGFSRPVCHVSVLQQRTAIPAHRKPDAHRASERGTRC